MRSNRLGLPEKDEVIGDPVNFGHRVTFKRGDGRGRPSAPMETLYLLAETDVSQLEDVIRRLRAIQYVTEVEAVTGPFDLILKIQAPHINEALDVVVHRIRKVPGVKSTETLVAVSGSP